MQRLETRHVVNYLLLLLIRRKKQKWLDQIKKIKCQGWKRGRQYPEIYRVFLKNIFLFKIIQLYFKIIFNILILKKNKKNKKNYFNIFLNKIYIKP